MEEIVGYIERITYQNPENGYTVAQLQQPKCPHLTCIVGTMPGLQPGETIRCKGAWKQHMIHGRQFDVAHSQVEAPADLIGIEKYLGSGLIKGIGPVYAKKIVDKFHIDTLNIIDRDPDRLSEIKGVGPIKLKKIKECWVEQRSIREVMLFLQKFDVSPTYAQKIFKRYGTHSLQILKENPFQIAKDIFGIGFRTADTIANKLGIPKDATLRIDAGIDYVLSQLSDDGHVCYPLDEFLIEAEKILEVPQDRISSRLQPLQEEERIVMHELPYGGNLKTFIWNRPLYTAETGIAREIRRLQEGESSLRKVEANKALDWVQKKLNIKLGKNQTHAVSHSLSEKIQIITGGPGTGKSTITNAIISITEKLTPNILLAAPTGRAAKRMTEITGKKAQTIHSLLEFEPRAGGFKRNKGNPLECDLLIVDEASMIDTLLMYSLLKAVPTHARVILVGDIHQLPSVGPGNVLKDLIASRKVPTTILNEIFRQAAGSQIITNAHKINEGMFPDIDIHEESDFFFLKVQDPEKVLETIKALVTQRLPRRYGFHMLDEIQVLAPMKKGIIGTENLNTVLQAAINPKEDGVWRFGRKYSEGDKVMQIRNNYQKEVYNGDVGMIKKIDQVEQKIWVTIDERDVEYDFSDLDELMLAYAVSIHKYQGSECPCIVIPVHTTHFKLLHRNLLYTGVTRGKKLVVLVGTTKALAICVKNDEVKRRFTGLQPAIVGVNHKILTSVL